MRRYANLIFVTFVLASLLATAIIPALPVAASPLLAPTFLPTKTDTIIGDDGDGKADPGEIIEYTVTIPNSGTLGIDDATGVTFTDIIDLNTTLVGGSLNVSPLALDNSYDTIGNTLLDVGGGLADPAVHVPGVSLFDNDTEFLSDTFTLKSVEVASGPAPITTATESGGSVTVNANGTFSYIPPVGFTGADHFDYVITDDGPDNVLGNADDLTGAGRVTLNVSTARVWYVKNNSTPGGLGRSSDPFDTLTEAQTASSTNDTIYVFAGDGTTTGQNAGIVLKNAQRLIGEGVALTVPVSVNGGPNPTTLRATGSQPQIDNTGGFGISVSDISNVQIFGLNIAGSTNAVNVTTTAANSGSFELANNTIRSASSNGIDVNGGGSGTLTVNLHDNTVTSAGNGIDILRSAGSVVITAFDDNVVSGNTGGIGINVVGTAGNEILFDATPGGNFDTVSGGVTTIGQSGVGNGVGASGLVLDSVKGDLTFNDLDIYTDNGNALFVDGPGSTHTISTGTLITASAGTPVLSATGGAAANLTEAAVNISLTSLTSTNSTARGVSIVNVSGTFSAPSGAITNASSPDFFVSGSGVSTATVDVTYGGTITDDLGTLVQIQNVTGATPDAPTYAFTGAITDGNDGDGSGISLDNNDSATIRFSGGLLLSTGANPAFTVTNGAVALEVCDENPCNPAATGALVNTLTTTTGTALNVANTNIGSNNLEFRSISVNGGANGIILSTTGTSGGLKVKGNGGTCASGNTGGCSGGIIQNTTGADNSTTTPVGTGIILNGTANVSLTRMYIHDHSNYGIRGTSVNGFTLDTSVVSGVNGTNVASPYNDSSILFDNLSGTSAITNSDISGGFYRNIHVDNTTGTLNLTVNNDLIHNTGAAQGDDGLFVEIGGGNATLTVTNNNFTAHGGDHFNLSLLGSPTVDLTFTGNFWSGGHAIGLGQGLFILAASFNSPGTFTYDILNNGSAGNPLVGNRQGGAMHVNKGSGTGSFSGTISNNFIGNAAVDGSGSSEASGIDVEAHGAGGSHTTLITNNTVRQFHNDGILLVAGEGNATFNATVTGNTVTNPDSSLASLHGMHFNIGTLPADNMIACLDVKNNSLTTAGNEANAGVDLRMRQRQLTTVRLPGYAGANNDNTAVQNFLIANGNAVTTILASNSVAGGGGGYLNTVGGAPCAQPVAMTLGNQAVANAQPSVNDSVPQGAQALTTINYAETLSTTLNAMNVLAVASGSGKLSAPSLAVAQHAPVIASTNLGGSKPLFRAERPIPALSGETVNVPIGNLPAGKTVTIKFRVTVNNPMSTSRILNQGNVTYTGGPGGGVNTTDPSPNADPACTGTGTQTCTPADRPDTTVSSINRQTPSNANSNASSITWRITFADAVSGLTSSNLTLVSGGTLSGTSVTSVTAVGGSPATQWDVLVNTGSGDGLLELNMTSDAGLSHDVLNGNTGTPFATGQDYTIDRTAPAVSSIVRQSPSSNPTNADILVFRVTFSEPVTSVGASSFVTTGTTTTVDSNVIAITPNLVFDFTVDGTANGDLANLNGTVGLNIASSPTITDLAGNTLTVVEPSPASNDETYIVDNTAPLVSSIVRQSPSSNPTNADILVFRVMFSEPVTSVGASSFITTGTTTTVDSNVIAITPNLVFDFTVDGTANGDLNNLNGTVGLNVVSSPLVQDLAGNILQVVEPMPAATNDQTYTLDNTVPTVTINQAAGQNDPTGNTPINFTVVFSEVVTDFDDAADVTLTGTAGATTVLITGGPTSYTVAVSGMSGSGTVIANIPSGVASDGANTNAASTSTDNTITFDATQPTVTINQAGGQNDPTAVSPINFTVVFSEAVTDFDDAADVNLSGTAGATTALITGGPTTYNVAVSGMTGDGTVIASIPAGVASDEVNTNAASTSTDNTVLFDAINPSVTINQAVGQSDPTNASSINFTVVFSEAVTDFDDAADVTLSGTAGATTILITGGPTTYNVAVSGMVGNGTVIASVPAGVVVDLASKPNAASTSSDDAVTYDGTAPTVTINQAAGQSDPANSSPINFAVVFSEAVTDFDDSADVTLTGTAGATTAVITGGPTTYNVAVSGMTADGTVIANIPANAAFDAGANPNTASTSSDNSVSYSDNIPPLVLSSALADANPTSLVNVHFTVTFSESVTGVDLSDFSLTTAGVSGAAITAVSGSGSVYTVTVNAGSNNGTIRLDVLDDDTIHDVFLNTLGGGYASGETYTIISKAPIFADVPYSYWANNYIERLYNAGITSGCGTGPLIYCPDDSVTRAQMAVFLLRAVHGAAYTPPPATGTVFGDVPATHWAAAWIEQFFAEGFTAGCGGGYYCPEQVETTRAQMAVFLLRAKHGTNYVPPAPSGVFGDVPVTYWAAAWIEQLAAEGITAGCGGGNYCPDASLTRAQMAVFLVKTLNLP